jgi:hypothetical protein
MGYEFRLTPARPYAAALPGEARSACLRVDFRIETPEGGVLEGKNIKLRAVGNECHASVAELLMSRFEIEDGACVSIYGVRASAPQTPGA